MAWYWIVLAVIAYLVASGIGFSIMKKSNMFPIHNLKLRSEDIAFGLFWPIVAVFGFMLLVSKAVDRVSLSLYAASSNKGK